MPGHKRNVSMAGYLKSLGAEIDITEVQGFDNLQNPEGVLKESMEMAAQYFGAKRSFYLVNGSTVGILAGVFALTGEGDTVLIARNCHMSVFNAVTLRKLNASFVEPEYIPEYNIAGSLTPKAVKDALLKNPDIRLVIVTSPSYEGVISDVKGIADVVHSFGASILVDEAHGAHLYGNGVFSGGAVSAGADIVVQSLHKTLPSLTQTAIAHVKDERFVKCFANWLNVFQTSSPSYILLSSIDGCIRILIKEGEKQFKIWQEALNSFEDKIRPLKHLQVLCRKELSSGIYMYDKSKILISTAKSDISGYNLYERLREDFYIEAEMVSHSLCLCMTGMGDSERSLLKLASALVEIDAEIGENIKNPQAIKLPRISMRIAPYKALGYPHKEIALDNSKGKTCAETIYAYPPGVPIAIPGSIITEDVIDAIKASELSGCKLQYSKTSKAKSITICL